MARWWTADLHLGHANVIGYTGRPFADVDAMDEALVDTWNGTVNADDEVWVLGDLAMGRIADSLALAELLLGQKVLVPGNHDRCWSGVRRGRREQWLERYSKAGFDVLDRPSPVALAGHKVLVSHFPYEGDSREEERHVDYRPVDRAGWLLHGHVHEKWRQRGRQINVGVDAWGGRPVGDDELAPLIAAGPGHLAPLPWR